ncbi:hypothetical protein H4582DRAFT_1556523 [Lactarius indigo]|nr:hypothetical protein H4582DRAFT_1556523 [Lactarius indigo]
MGGVTGLAGGATNAVTQGINGLGGATNLVGDATKGIAEGISLIQSGEKEVAENIAHLLSGEQGAVGGVLVPTIAKDVIQATVGNTNAIAGAALQSVTNPVAVIGATQAAVTGRRHETYPCFGERQPITQSIANPTEPREYASSEDTGICVGRRDSVSILHINMDVCRGRRSSMLMSVWFDSIALGSAHGLSHHIQVSYVPHLRRQ